MYNGSNCDQKSQLSEILTEPLNSRELNTQFSISKVYDIWLQRHIRIENPSLWQSPNSFVLSFYYSFLSTQTVKTLFSVFFFIVLVIRVYSSLQPQQTFLESIYTILLVRLCDCVASHRRFQVGVVHYPLSKIRWGCIPPPGFLQIHFSFKLQFLFILYK